MSLEDKEFAEYIVDDNENDRVNELYYEQVRYVKSEDRESDRILRVADDVLPEHYEESKSSELDDEECRDPGTDEREELLHDAAVGAEYECPVGYKSEDDCQKPCDRLVEEKEQIKRVTEDRYVLLCRYEVIENSERHEVYYRRESAE